MPKTLFTPTPRGRLQILKTFPNATQLSSGEVEDKFRIGDCHVTCRYWLEGGDFVSKQMLGCGNAIHTGQIACAAPDAAVSTVYRTKSLIGIVGPDKAVDEVASALGARFTGVLIGEAEAHVVGN